jgi:hypothetical protein
MQKTKPAECERVEVSVAGTGQLSNLLLADFIALSSLQVVV